MYIVLKLTRVSPGEMVIVSFAASYSQPIWNKATKTSMLFFRYLLMSINEKLLFNIQILQMKKIAHLSLNVRERWSYVPFRVTTCELLPGYHRFFLVSVHFRFCPLKTSLGFCCESSNPHVWHVVSNAVQFSWAHNHITYLLASLLFFRFEIIFSASSAIINVKG